MIDRLLGWLGLLAELIIADPTIGSVRLLLVMVCCTQSWAALSPSLMKGELGTVRQLIGRISLITESLAIKDVVSTVLLFLHVLN